MGIKRMIAVSLLLICGFISVHAQLNIIDKNKDIREYTVKNALPYDSLTNMENHAALPGQTLFMNGARNTSYGYTEVFFTGNFLTGNPTQYGSDSFKSTPSDKVENKYFDVVKVWIKQGPLGGTGCCMLLKEKESGAEVYYNPYIYRRAMTCVGYYEKLKRHIGQKFLSLAKKVETMSGEVMMLEEGQEYRCVDLGMEMNADGAILIMEDAKGQQVKGTPIAKEVYEFVSLDHIDKAIGQYGKKYGKNIAMRHVSVGMTPDMVIAAWGTPYRKHKVEAAGTTKDFWYFDRNHYVELVNGKVVKVSL